MEDNFWKALQSSREVFMDLVEKHQSISEKSVLKTLLRSLTNKPSSNSKLCDALSLYTTRAIFSFETLTNSHGQEDVEEGNEIFKNPHTIEEAQKTDHQKSDESHRRNYAFSPMLFDPIISENRGW